MNEKSQVNIIVAVRKFGTNITWYRSGATERERAK